MGFPLFWHRPHYAVPHGSPILAPLYPSPLGSLSAACNRLFPPYSDATSYLSPPPSHTQRATAFPHHTLTPLLLVRRISSPTCSPSLTCTTTVRGGQCMRYMQYNKQQGVQ